MKLNSWHAKFYIRFCMKTHTYNLSGTKLPLYHTANGKEVTRQNPQMPDTTCAYWGDLLGTVVIYLFGISCALYYFYLMCMLCTGNLFVDENAIGGNELVWVVTTAVIIGVYGSDIFKFTKKILCKKITWTE